MNKKIFIPLLLLAPLLVANSPAPSPTEKDYDNIAVTATYLSQDQYGVYHYRLEVENIGEEYAGIFRYGSFYYGGVSVYPYDDNAFLFDSEMISPNQTRVFEVCSDRQLDLDNDKFKWVTWAFDNPDTDVTFSDNPTIKLLDDKRYEMEVDVKNMGDYYYAVVAEVDYDGVNYAFYFSSDSKIFRTNQDLDLSKITITKLSAYRSSYNRYHFLGVNWELVLQVIFWVLLGTILFHGIVAMAVFIPLSIRKKRRQNNTKSN